MERIGVLINKLQELYQERATPDQLNHVLQMLQTELFLVKQQQAGTTERKKISVMMPANVAVNIPEQSTPVAEKKDTHDLAGTWNINLEEAVVKIPLQEEKKSIIKEPQPEISRFNVLEEVPTLAHQPQVRELNEVIGKSVPSLNEKLNEQKTELVEKLKDEPLRDIKKAIGLNDRYIFIMELFRGDEPMYERSLKTINHFTIYPEAEFWIQRELKLKLGWKEDHPAVKQFDQLVRRRFL